MGRQWTWSTTDADWSVTLDQPAGVVRWLGADKPRPGVPGRALAGGGKDQPARDLLTSGRPAYPCPPEILVEVLVAARAALPIGAEPAVTTTLPPLAPHPIDVVLRSCQPVARKLTGASGPLAESRTELLVEELPDDRPTQASGYRYFTDVRLGDRVTFLCVEELGGWLRGDADWFTADFAGAGRLALSFDEHRTTITGAPTLVAALANAFAMDLRPDLDDRVVHDRADALVRRQLGGQPDFVWDVATEHCREGLVVRGRASAAALALYYDLIPTERFFIMQLDEVSAASPP